MSIVQNPLIGKARQSMGGATFSSWKGINVLKTKPLTVANPNTDLQQMRRSALAQLVAIFRLIPAVINSGYLEQAVKQSPYNAFVGDNATSAFDFSSPPDADLAYEDLKVAKGTIAAQPIATYVIDDSANTIVITWSASSLQPGQSNSDVLVFAARNNTTKAWQSEVTAVTRGTETASIPQSIAFAAGTNCECYSFFINLSSGKASSSVYTPVTVVA